MQHRLSQPRRRFSSSSTATNFSPTNTKNILPIRCAALSVTKVARSFLSPNRVQRPSNPFAGAAGHAFRLTLKKPGRNGRWMDEALREFAMLKPLCHTCGMTDIFKIVRLFFTQVVKRRTIPFGVSADVRNDDLVDVRRRNQVLRELDDSEGW